MNRRNLFFLILLSIYTFFFNGNLFSQIEDSANLKEDALEQKLLLDLLPEPDTGLSTQKHSALAQLVEINVSDISLTEILELLSKSSFPA